MLRVETKRFVLVVPRGEEGDVAAADGGCSDEE